MSVVIFICAIFIGLSLGMFGSGGAILTLPILIYVMGYEEKQAVISSLFIVAAISALASIPNWRQKLVDTRLLSIFAIPGVIGSYLGAYLGSFSAPRVQLLLLVTLIFLAASKMLYFNPSHSETCNENKLKLLIVGLGIGTVTGFVGVGGGFLIVPALIFLGGVNFKQATATSLMLIVIQSSIAIYSYYQYASAEFVRLDWLFILIFTIAGVLGTYFSAWLKPYLNQAVVSKLFAYFLLTIASFILVDRLLL